MRAIIRYSVDGESDGKLSNLLRKILESHGFALNPNVTATYENPSIGSPALAKAMQAFWQQAMNPPNAAHVDHVWMYSDNPPPVPVVAPPMKAT